MPLQQQVLADSPAGLARALELLGDLDPVGIDVERADWDRYWRAAALIQVGGEGRVALVDPMLLDDLSPLHDWLQGRTTVFHALENDLGPLVSRRVVPSTVEDTAIAAAMLGLATGLESLLRELLDVELAGDKAAMQRADWEARPLTEEMLAYAAGDVADLPQLWAVLAQRLEDTGRMDWYRQELAALTAQPPVEERRDWTRTKGMGRLDPMARSRLRALWDTREQLARTTDTAPARILGDRQLVDLAVRPPASVGELGRRGVRRHAARQFGPALLAALAEAARRGPEPSRRSAATRIPTDADRQLADTLRTLRAQRAEELGIDAGVLCPSRTLLSAVLADPQTPEELRAALGLRAWQWEQVGPAFCEALAIARADADARSTEEGPAGEGAGKAGGFPAPGAGRVATSDPSS